ncbi:response regulator [Paraflavitalea pollutisoli]|uniref:response regulator n=1 Tax=Paraflavitalea pollutisoli TaxID=3034143 RepID=UPI0023EB491E|nr:response regulator [Paraflavitalea sp. H1-2-19X]
MTKGPIIIVDDDPDDRDIYAEIIRDMGIPNQIRFFNGGQECLQYLSTTTEQPFVILSDINMPRMNGLEFKEKIQADEYLRQKGIPFVFISTNAHPSTVRKAHILSVQGYFMKPASMGTIRTMLTKIFDYWELCKHINNV